MQRKTNTKSHFDEKLDFEAFFAFSHSLYQFVDFTRFSAHRNPYKSLQNNELHPFSRKQTDYILAQKTRFSARNQPILAMKNEIFVSIWCYFTPFSVQITLFPLLNYISLLFALTFLLCLNLVYSTFEERTDQQSHTKRSGVVKNQFGDSGRRSAFYALFQLRSQNAQTAKQQPKGSSFALHNSFKTAPALLTKVPHHNSLPYSPCTRTHPQQENYKKTQSSFSSAFSPLCFFSTRCHLLQTSNRKDRFPHQFLRNRKRLLPTANAVRRSLYNQRKKNRKTRINNEEFSQQFKQQLSKQTLKTSENYQRREKKEFNAE